jgi:hypothetical protein
MTVLRVIVILLALSVLFSGCLPVDNPPGAWGDEARTSECRVTRWYVVCEIALTDGTRCAVTASGGITCDWTGGPQGR